MRHVETTFAFLGRVHTPYFARVRTMLNRWIERYPATHRGRLLTRLRSASSEQQLGAFWELYIHEVMTAAGWEMTVDPSVPGTRHVPDFLAVRGGEGMYIEATSSSRSNQQIADDNRLARVLDELAKLGPAEFALWVQCERSGSDSPPVAGLRDELAAWRSGLSRAAALEAYLHGGYEALPTYEWKRNGWAFSFIAQPWSDERVGTPDLPAIGAEGRTEVTIVDHSTPMQRAFRAKHKRYGATLAHPLVLAYLDMHEFIASDLSHLNALFGPLTGGPDGCWFAKNQPVNRDVAALLAVWNLRPTRVLGSMPVLFRNPWATTPLMATLPWPTVEFDPADAVASRTEPSVSLAELLGISAEFGGDGNPFEGE